VALAWLDYRRLALTAPDDLALACVGAGFLALGLFVGWRLFAPAPVRPAGNPQAVAKLGISGRELEVLEALARGQANKEIARALSVSPNTVKTHVARLYEKLGAARRTDAVARARDLGILR
jgi:DNA-binding CsgD family transcriptional regulator